MSKTRTTTEIHRWTDWKSALFVFGFLSHRSKHFLCLMKIDDLERTVVEIKLNQSNDQSDRTDPTDSSTRSRPVDQCPNPWQKRSSNTSFWHFFFIVVVRSVHSKSMDRIEPMQNSEVICLPPKELLIRYSSKSISDHVGTQSSAVPDLIRFVSAFPSIFLIVSFSNSTLFFNTPSVGATGKRKENASIIVRFDLFQLRPTTINRWLKK